MCLGALLVLKGNFNSKRGAAAVADRFPDTRFTAVFCDYFRWGSIQQAVDSGSSHCMAAAVAANGDDAAQQRESMPVTAFHLIVAKQPTIQIRQDERFLLEAWGYIVVTSIG